MSERRRIIEGTWNCSSCENAGIPGGQKVCPACGNPREDEEAKFDFGKRDASGASELASVDDAAKLELAAAGADWYCANCGTANTGTAEQCKACGNADAEGRLAKKPDKPVAAPPTPPPEPPKKSGGSMFVRAIGCFFLGSVPLVLGAFALIVALTFWKTEETGQITGMQWSRDVHLETWTKATKTGWKTDFGKRPSVMPTSGKGEYAGADNVRSCTRKEKSPKKCEQKTKKTACGTEEKCEVKDLGNGFAEEVCKDVTKYCDEKYEECTEAVIDDWCTYDTYEWKRAKSAHAEGVDAAPKWPADAPSAGALDRLVKAEKYTIEVAYGAGEQAVFEPTTEAEYTQWAPQQPVTVVVNGLGQIDSLLPAK